MTGVQTCALPISYVSDAGLRISSANNVYGSRWNISNNTLTGDPTSGGNSAGAEIIGVSGLLLLRDIVVSGNTCVDSAPCGMNIASNGQVDIERIKIRNNVANKTGTAYVGSAAMGTSRNVSFRMSDAEISGNTVADGVIFGIGASYNDYNTTTLAAVAPAPALSNSFLVENSTIHGNTSATSFVSYLATPGIYTFRNVTIANNLVGTGTSGCGGGISVQAYQLFSGSNAVQVKVQNSTIARNRVAGCQAAIGFGSYSPAGPVPVTGTLLVESSILGREAAGGVKDVIFGNDASKITLVKTIVEDGAGPMFAQCNTNGNLCNTNPLLDVLALNGGPTPTMRLLPGSPALNAGSNPAGLTTDQRGAARVIGAAADMGAFESPPMAAGACNLDMDGDNALTATKEGLVLLRAMLGFTGANTTTGTGITATQWANARPLINSNCGTNFAP